MATFAIKFVAFSFKLRKFCSQINGRKKILIHIYACKTQIIVNLRQSILIIENMKKKRSIILLFFLCFIPLALLAQEKTVKGKVLEKETGDPLPGVTVMVEKTPRGVMTDVDGAFEIKVNSSDKLVFTYIGMESQTIAVGSQNYITVKLLPKSDELAEVTVVAFGKQKKESVVSSITTVNVSDLRVPSSNLTSSFAGNIAGMIAYTRSGEPGTNNTDFFIRGITTFGDGGSNPLILIDNIELTTTDLNRLRPDDIESFSILKDASATALYGARGANGVILVTTKRGLEGKSQVSARVEHSFQSSIRNLELADPVTYMKMYNEAVLTRNPSNIEDLIYSQDKIEQTGKEGANRLIYPANDWYNMMFKDVAQSTRADVSIRGGGKVAQYYVSGAYTQDGGILKVDHRNSFNNNIDSKVYSLRANVDVNVTNTTKLGIRLTGNFDDYTGPTSSGSDMYVYVMHADPVLFPAYYPMDDDHIGIKHIMFGNYDEGSYINPYAQMVKGYKNYQRSQMLASVELDQDLSFITKGLKFTSLFNLSRSSDFTQTRQYSPYYYTLDSYDSYTGEYHIRRLNETGTDYLSYSEGDKNVTNTMYWENRLYWNQNFGVNTLGALLVFTTYEKREANKGSLQLSLPSRNVSLAGRATYGYDDRYFAEFNFAYNGSERFAKHHRWGFFPSFGVGWMISNEKFFLPLRNTISKLKLRLSYGLVGNDNIGDSKNRFFYLSRINMTSTSTAATFGKLFQTSYKGISVSQYANEAITWEKSYKQNYALELSLWGDLDIIAEYYKEYRKNIYMKRADIPNTMGLQASIGANIGEASAHGIDIQLEYKKSWNKDLWTSARGNFTFARSKYEVYEEPEYAESYRGHVGYSIKQNRGYIAERLFIDDEEAANSPSQSGFGSQYGGGDIKYTDVNGDGEITEADMVPIGNPTSPEIIYGFGVSAGYKGFDFSVFFQGLANESFWMNMSGYSDKDENTKAGMAPFYANTQLLKAIADNHWSEDNRDIYAFYPRLSTTVNYNNTATSTWWMRDGSFIRLKQMEFGYTVPQKITKKWHMNNLRFYVSGNNLFSWSSFKMWDPEQGTSALNYPIQRTINVGLNLTFE